MEKSAAHLQRLAIAPEQFQDQHICLNSDQHHYLYNVLRLCNGDRFIALNGQGQLWIAELLANPTQVALIESLTEETELTVPVMLLAAPPKGNHFDQVVRSSTELGVSHIVPVLSERTLLQPSPNKIERWQRIVTEAAEQSHRQIIPKVLEPVSFAAVVAGDGLHNSHPWQKYICTVDPAAPHFLECLSQRSDNATTGFAIMVGPEGGWTDTEKKQAQLAGYQSVSLGRRTLRAVTATYMVLSIAIAHLERQTTHKGGLV